jgi:alpha-L-fucosidase
VNLQAGHRYPIRIDYTEGTGEAYLKLFWSAPDQGQMIVPTSQLSPT